MVPALASVALNQSEAATLALLMLFEDADILKHQYEIVCRSNNTVLTTVSDKSELADTLPLHCQFCDAQHNADDLRVELVFEVKPSAVQVFRQHAFA